MRLNPLPGERQGTGGETGLYPCDPAQIPPLPSRLTEEKRWTITQRLGAMAWDESPQWEDSWKMSWGALAAGRTPLVLTERYAHAKRLQRPIVGAVWAGHPAFRQRDR